MTSAKPTSRLSDQSLEARDVKSISRLTDRQLNEWDRRGALPSLRTDPRRWRRFSAWQAIAISIVSELQRHFGMPLKKQKPLMWWMLGEEPTSRDLQRQMLSEVVLMGGEDSLPTVLHNLVPPPTDTSFDSVDPVLLRFPDGQPPPPPNRPDHVVDTEASIRAQGPLIAKCLATRGWESGAAQAFVERFMRLSSAKRFGVGTYTEISGLRSDALHVQDYRAVAAVNLLGHALLPLTEALTILLAGFPPVLLTDFVHSTFVDPYRHAELASAGRLPPAMIALRVDAIINKVLTHLCGEPLDADLDPARASRLIRVSPDESTVLEMLRKKGIDRIVIEHPREGYRIELQETLNGIRSISQIEELLRKGEYQTVTIKQADGNIVRVEQNTSIKVPAGRDGRAPTSRGHVAKR